MNTKEFVKWVLAVLCGLFVWGIVKAIFFLMMIGSFATSASSVSSSAPVLPKEGVLVMDMANLVIAEQSSESMPSLSLTSLSSLGSTMTQTIGIYDAVRAIHKAAEDPGVKLILLKTDNIASELSNVSEIREGDQAEVYTMVEVSRG